MTELSDPVVVAAVEATMERCAAVAGQRVTDERMTVELENADTAARALLSGMLANDASIADVVPLLVLFTEESMELFGGCDAASFPNALFGVLVQSVLLGINLERERTKEASS